MKMKEKVAAPPVHTPVPRDMRDLGSVCLGIGNSLLTLKDYIALEVGTNSTWTFSVFSKLSTHENALNMSKCGEINYFVT